MGSAATETVLITGCGSGIGKALAENMHRRRTRDGRQLFTVIATDYSATALTCLEEQGIKTLVLDVTDANSVKAAVDSVLATEGHIDLLVCNAGCSVAGWLVEVKYTDVEKIFDVNVHGVFRVIQAVAPSMMDRRKGKIATLASANSYVVEPFRGSYAGTKAAVAMMTEALRMEIEPFGISVTSVIPAWVKSDIIPNTVVDYDRYGSQDGYYHGIMYRILEKREAVMNSGITTQKAAEDIANGLSKPKPPRFLKTGNLLLAFIGAFLQTWFGNTFIARRLQHEFHLDRVDRLGKGSVPNEGDKSLPFSLRKEE